MMFYKKFSVFILFLLILVVPVLSLEVCKDVVPVGVSCEVLTPTITSCGVLNYSVISQNGTIVSSGLLESVSNDVYKFNFSENEGDYIIQLCEGSTREIRVGGDDMNWMSIVVSVGLMIFLLLFVAFNIKDKEFKNIKMFLFLMGTALTFLLGFLPFVISHNSSDVAAFQPVGIALLSASGMLLLYFVYLYVMDILIIKGLIKVNVGKGKGK